MRRIVLALCILFLLAQLSCSGDQPKISPPEIHSAVIFIPGYKGSVLRENLTDEKVWLTASEILFGNRSLALLGKEVGITNSVEVHPDGLFKSFSVLPWIYSYSIYDHWIDFLRTHLPADTQLVEFGYDWRMDNAENAQLLAKTINMLEKKGVRDISIVSHSMGGIILSYYLRYGVQDPENAKETWEGATHVNRVIFAGPPFRGAVTIMHDIDRGNPTIVNDQLISKAAIGTFYSSYQLLPPSIDHPFLGVDGKPMPLNTESADTWDRYDWGFLSETKSGEFRQARLEVIRSRLRRAAIISSLINRPKQTSDTSSRLSTDITSKPNYLVIVGNGRATPAYALFDESKKPTLSFADEKLKKLPQGFEPSMLFQDGDGLVTLESSALPPAYAEEMRGDTIFRNIEHGEFYNDDELRGIVIQFLNSGRESGSKN